MKPSELLREAADGWTAETWCQGEYVDCAGRECAKGRLIGVASDYDVLALAEDFLRTEMDALSIIKFNDAPGRTFPEVLAAFERAAQLAEAEGQ